MKKVFSVFLVLVMLLSLAACGSSSSTAPASSAASGAPASSSAANDFASQKYNLRVGTTSVGGVYNLVASAWAQTIQKHLPNVVWDVQVTGGSVGNLQLFSNKELDLPMTLGVTMVDAEKGGSKSFPDPVKFQSICVVNQGFFHIAVAANSGIKTIQDLKGKKISTAEPGHSTESVAVALFDILGWNIETDIQRQRQNLQDSVDALADGRIDAMFYMGGCPVASIKEACTTSKTATMLSIDQATLDKVTEKYPYLVTGTAKAGVFANDEPITSLGCNNFLCCAPEMDEELVYQMTKALFDNCTEWQSSHSSVAELTAANACVGSPVDFHPGAIRYFKEAGVWGK